MLIERLMEVLSGTPNAYSLLGSYPNLMKILSDAFPPPKYMFLSKLLFKIDGTHLCSLPLPQYISLIQLFSKTYGTPLCSLRLPQYVFLTHCHSNDENPLWSVLPIPIHIPYSILIQNWCKSSLEPPCPAHKSSLGALLLPLYMTLIHLLLKMMKNLSGVSLHPKTHLLFNYYPKLMQIFCGPSFPPNTYSLSSSNPKLVEILGGATRVPGQACG